MEGLDASGSSDPQDNIAVLLNSNNNESVGSVDVKLDNEVDVISSGNDVLPEDSRRLSMADGGNSSCTPLAQQQLPADDSGLLESQPVPHPEQNDVAEGLDEQNTSAELPTFVASGSINRLSPGGFADERDPNYATQRPDTLGAITSATQGLLAAGMIPPQFAGPHAGMRLWMADSGHSNVDGASFADDNRSGARLGRRTRGAGMDQLELNQRYPLDADVGGQSENDDASNGDTESDIGDEDDDDDTGMQADNQCESTEADQYKMDPEVDQSDGNNVSSFLHAANHSDTEAVVNLNGAAGNQWPYQHRHQDRCGPNVNTQALSHDNCDIDKAEEDQPPPFLHQLTNSVNSYTNQGVRMSSPRGYSSSVARQVKIKANSGPISDPGSVTSQAEAVTHNRVPSTGFSFHSASKQGSGVPITSSNSKAGVSAVGNTGSREALVHADQAASAFKPVVTSKASAQQNQCKTGSGLQQKPLCNVSNHAAGSIRCKGQQQQHVQAGAVWSTGYPDAGGKPLHSNKMVCETADCSKPAEAGMDQSDMDYALCSGRTLLQGQSGMQLVMPVSISRHATSMVRELDEQRSFRDGQKMEVESVASTAFSAAVAPNGFASSMESLRFAGSFNPGDSSSQQVTPLRVCTRLHQQLLDDSLDMSPIRPASSAGSQRTSSFHGLESISNRGDQLAGVEFGPYCNQQVSDIASDIRDMEAVRGQLNKLLLMSEQVIPGCTAEFDKALYDQTRDDVNDLLTSRSAARLTNPSSDGSGVTNFTVFRDALPMLSKYLIPSVSSTVSSVNSKPDPAALLAENHALRDAMEQQRFKLKHCEKQIQLLQSKTLELQQNLAVSVSTDRKKDLMIEQLDKALYKVVDSWQCKESERQHALQHLQMDKNALQQALDSQQQVVARFEKQLKQTLGQLHSEQQRAISVCNEKDHQIDALQKECDRLSDEISREREQCRRLVDTEKRDMLAVKDKLHAQMAQLRAVQEEERTSWDTKEREYLQKIDELTDSHMESVEQHKVQIEKQKQLLSELQVMQKAAQMQVEKLQLELDTTLRERESLKVELSLAEARIESSKRKLEAELQIEADRELTTRLEEVEAHHAEKERKLHEMQRCNLQELAQQHRTELQRLAEEHEEALRWMEDKHRHETSQHEDRIRELHVEMSALQEENKRIMARSVEISSQLQSMMQSHCSEALRLLQLSGSAASAPKEMLRKQTAGDRIPSQLPNGNSLVVEQPAFQSSDGAMSQLSSVQTSSTSAALLRSSASAESVTVPHHQQSVQSSQAVDFQSASSQFSTQYSQFLDSVRGFQPLLADLNASIASVANSVSTMGVDVCNGQQGKSELSEIGVARPWQISGSIAGHQGVQSEFQLHSPVALRPSSNGAVFSDDAEDFTGVQGSPRNGHVTLAATSSRQTLLNQLLQQTVGSGPNSSCESNGSDQRSDGTVNTTNSDKMPAVSSGAKLQQQESRHQELNHYIRILLQRSPGGYSDAEIAASGGAGCARDRCTTPDSNPVAACQQNLGRSTEHQSSLPITNAGASGVLTIHQVNEIARMLERHQVATLGTNGASSNGVSEMLAYIQATQASGLRDMMMPADDRPSSPIKEMSQKSTHGRQQNNTKHFNSHVTSVEADVSKAPARQCRQTETSLPQSDSALGPGRPDLQPDPSRKGRTTALNQDPAVRGTKPSTFVPIANGMAKKPDRKAAPQHASSKNVNRQTTSAWK